MTRVREDETLYSAMARASRYLGAPRPGLMHQALFGADLAIVDGDLPVGLDEVARSGVFGVADLGTVLHGWTAFPYYAHFVAPGRADVAAETMAGVGRWPHEVLGSWSSTVPPPDRLRFCLECREEMLELHPDLWWKRVHQLPSVLACPDHGEPLLLSEVSREARSSVYVPASLATCPTSAPRVVGRLEPRVQGDLVMLARASDTLLDRECGEHPDDRRMNYLGRLRRLGLLNRAGEADLGKVARALDGYWGETLNRWPGLIRDGRCGQRWLGALLWGEHSSPPLHHLLLQGMLAARLRW